MRTSKYFLAIIVSVYAFIGACKESKQENKLMKTPVAAKIQKKLTTHGHTRIDNYFWLNERENPDVIAYLKAENSYTESILEHVQGFRNNLFKEIVDRIMKEDITVPYMKNGYYYYKRYHEHMEYEIYCRKLAPEKNVKRPAKPEDISSEEHILLDVNKMAEGHEYYDVSGIDVSQDNKIIAFGADSVGRRRYTIFFKNIETGELLKDAIPNVTGEVAWANDNKTVFYTTQNDALRSDKVFRHILGADPKEDVLVFHEIDETFSVDVHKTRSEKYIIIGSSSTMSDEIRFLNADNPLGEFKIIQQRERGLEYSVSHFGDKFYIVTNENAPNFKLVETMTNNPGKENWKEIIAHRNDVLLENIELFRNFLVVEERKNALTQMRIIKWSDRSEHFLNFGEEAYTAYIHNNPDFDTDILRFGYTSMTTPASVYDYNMHEKTKQLLKQTNVVGDFNSENYHTERLYAKARDGVMVPVSIVYRKGIKKESQNPLLLYAYGSYGSSSDAYFSSSRLSLLDRGFIFAIAHVRGGEDMGRQWYEDGKLLKKKNTFTDFIDCAEFVITEKYTCSDKLFAMGGSAGGLLMGAISNMRPDLFKGIIAAVPFVDVITTMLDESIPLTTGEFDEWGNPKDSVYYNYILSYSPYDNVEPKNYPAMLVTTGLHDSQVQYWEPAKWVAKLRELKTDKNILLLSTNMDAGHGGASGRFAAHKETALEFVFMFHLLGIKE